MASRLRRWRRPAGPGPFAASDLVPLVRDDLSFFGRPDLQAPITAASVGRALQTLGLPYHRTGSRRAYTLTYPVFNQLVQRLVSPFGR